MKAFQVEIPNEAHTYAGTMSTVRAVCKAVDKKLRPDVMVREIDVKSDKDSFIQALNGHPVIELTGRVWGLSSRGALVEETE